MVVVYAESMTIDEYINKLRVEDAESHIGREKDDWLGYIEFHRDRFGKVLDAIPKSTRPIKVLDVGPTPFTFFIATTFPQYEISALDRTNVLETPCNEMNISLKTCNLNEEGWPFQDGYFDVVIFTEVLEHIFNRPTDVLNEVRRVMRQQGLLILSVPNFASLQNRIKLLFGVTPLPNLDDVIRKQATYGHDHIHEYTMDEIVRLLEGCSFAISNKKYLQPPILEGLTASEKGWPLKLAHRAMMFLVPSSRVTIYIECRKL